MLLKMNYRAKTILAECVAIFATSFGNAKEGRRLQIMLYQDNFGTTRFRWWCYRYVSSKRSLKAMWRMLFVITLSLVLHRLKETEQKIYLPVGQSNEHLVVTENTSLFFEISMDYIYDPFCSQFCYYW